MASSVSENRLALMYPATIVLSIFIIWCRTVVDAASCPSDTALVSSSDGKSAWCLRRFNATPTTFCEAVKTCHQRGEKMLGKSVLDAIRASARPADLFFNCQSASGYAAYIWVGLTDALLERGASKDGWSWLDTTSGLTTAMDGPTYFDPAEPNSQYNQDCVTVYGPSWLLRDGGCNELNFFYCYSEAAKLSAGVQTGSQVFLPAKIVNYSQPDPGCWIGPLHQASLRHCAGVCFNYGTPGDCVGFYWHPSRLRCVLLPFFDASVTLEFANAEEKRLWRKFALAKN